MGLELQHRVDEFRLDPNLRIAEVLRRRIQRPKKRPQPTGVGRVTQTQSHPQAKLARVRAWREEWGPAGYDELEAILDGKEAP